MSIGVFMNLDDIELFVKKNKNFFLESIENFPKQVGAIQKIVKTIDLGVLKKDVNNIILTGMGGSALGGRIAKSYLINSLDVPFEIVNNYHLPNYADSKSLIIISSYSGNTEETVSCYHDAKKRGAKVIVVANGGILKELAKKNSDPSILFEGEENPSKSPRLGIGYSLTALLLVLDNFCSFKHDEINEDLLTSIASFKDSFGINNPEVNNHAKQIARALYNKTINIVSADFLTGVAYNIKNQFNENAKTFSCFFDIPELNHHLLEGLSYPKSNRLNMKFLIIESNLFSGKIIKRLQITKEVFEKNYISYAVFTPISDTKIKQIFETIYFGTYLSYYLAFLNDIDPYPIPWVDYFKERMSK